MEISTIVNITLAILSFILAAFSLIFVILTLKQNQKLIEQNNRTIEQNNQMIDDSSRPYITLYLDAITICEQSSFFVIKNFGHTPALITDFKYDPMLKQTKQSASLMQEQFDYVKQIVLAPGQSRLLYYDVTKLPADILTFEISYIANKTEYHEIVTMNVKHFIRFPVPRPSSHIENGNERYVHTLRERLDRTL